MAPKTRSKEKRSAREASETHDMTDEVASPSAERGKRRGTNMDAICRRLTSGTKSVGGSVGGSVCDPGDLGWDTTEPTGNETVGKNIGDTELIERRRPAGGTSGELGHAGEHAQLSAPITAQDVQTLQIETQSDGDLPTEPESTSKRKKKPNVHTTQGRRPAGTAGGDSTPKSTMIPPTAPNVAAAASIPPVRVPDNPFGSPLAPSQFIFLPLLDPPRLLVLIMVTLKDQHLLALLLSKMLSMK
ncbi:hypothetical protein BSKO_13886 [Bryopsis sp. KO-2023]|nr:hypothetical protein BSKO_13886 [Bryopsis sp. KO-2023]